MRKTGTLAHSAIYISLLAICSWISIPFAVPFTLQTFAVFLAAYMLGARRSAAAIGAYLLLGACGVPVFSGFTGGISALVGPTGGFLTGFVPAAVISGLLIRNESFACAAAGMCAGLAAMYITGVLWYIAAFGVSPSAAIMTCVVPFIPFDAAKIALAAFVGGRLKRALR